MDLDQGQGELNLLWPVERALAGTAGRAVAIGAQAAHDIGLEAALSGLLAGRRRDIVAPVWRTLCTDPDVIAYRQDVVEDLLSDPTLVEELTALLPTLQGLVESGYQRLGRQSNRLFEVAYRLGELESIVDVVEALAAALGPRRDRLRSAGLRALYDHLRDVAAEPVFQRLVAELPTLLDQVRHNQSVTIGINLDDHLRPVEATLLAVNKERFVEGTLLSRLFPRGDGRRESFEAGLAPLHSVAAAAGGPLPADVKLKPSMVPLFRDLADVLDKVCRPLARALEAYAGVNGRWLAGLGSALAFFLGACDLVNSLRTAGLPVCRPTIVPAEARRAEVDDAYNLNLALRRLNGASDAPPVVTNDIRLGPTGRIQILTGPNQGGKTTYVQTVGQVQLMAQIGLFVPGRRAVISPVDAILTHFPIEEQYGGHGRFGEEAQRLQALFSQATRHSLLLFNESLASTGAGEGVFLAQDLVRVMRRLGTRAVFATHLHALADDIGTLNGDDEDVVSLVASAPVEGEAPGEVYSYKVAPGPPLGRSFARELAGRYGIRYEQLVADLAARGALPDDATPAANAP